MSGTNGNLQVQGARVELGFEIINFTDAVVSTLTAPAGANIAEMQPQGGSILYMFGANPGPGIRVTDLGRLELESEDEINKFRVTGAPGSSGQLIVHYFYTSIENA